MLIVETEIMENPDAAANIFTEERDADLLF